MPFHIRNLDNYSEKSRGLVREDADIGFISCENDAGQFNL
ncbi:hypothetical protein C943_02422 [Mariniradius saccharolyticus AK6]|uniref:Uncharacterized protein n=1 Tax=Mariniradius saccharolyticus AK6 TaxID=1239962 RepID=M7X186_9BACT|nr:hypothetical protein C943_02422 [Mariniradius saccharolyticus AK6]